LKAPPECGKFCVAVLQWKTSMKPVKIFVFLLAILVGHSLSPAYGVSQAHAGVEPGAGKGWLTIASRTRAEDAIALAQEYVDPFPTAVVFASSNGYFAVSLGWADIRLGTPFLERLKDSGAIPSDSYFTAGARFLHPVWTANNSQNYPLAAFIAATKLPGNGATTPSSANEQSTPVPPSIAVVGGLEKTGDNFLSLRTGPGTNYPEIARMRINTRVTITGTNGNWREIALDNGLRGWAFGGFLQSATVPVIGPSPPQANAGVDDKAIPMIGPDKKPERASADPSAIAPAESEDIETSEHALPDFTPSGDKRVALVMGNSKYVHTTELPNPKNDADAISNRLEKLGFDVITALNGGKAGMELAIRDFVKALNGADVALFFYAGHAMQVDGRNHLIPVDAKLEDSTAIDFETIDLGVILNFMNSSNRISIALLDACRDNPLSRRFARSFGATRSAFIGRGLAAPSTGAGELLIGFATAPGEVALDGEGDNSPFTTALLNHIETKGLDIELMLKRVRQDVFELTNQSQEPWVNSALRREFQFNPATAESP
jgi:uncharacterized protein YraI